LCVLCYNENVLLKLYSNFPLLIRTLLDKKAVLPIICGVSCVAYEQKYCRVSKLSDIVHRRIKSLFWVAAGGSRATGSSARDWYRARHWLADGQTQLRQSNIL